MRLKNPLEQYLLDTSPIEQLTAEDSQKQPPAMWAQLAGRELGPIQEFDTSAGQRAMLVSIVSANATWFPSGSAIITVFTLLPDDL